MLINKFTCKNALRFTAMPLTALRFQQGAAAVELAIVVVLLLLVVAGTISFGRVFWYADALTKSTRDGARLMSTWPIATLNTDGRAAAQSITINTANAASVSPQLTTDNVRVECLNDSFNVVTCALPMNVRVSITGFNVTLGEWFPFYSTSGPAGSVPLVPQTTMRYMK